MTDVEPAPERAAPSAPPALEHRPWTVQRVLRGGWRRTKLAVLGARDAALLPIAAGSGVLSSLHYAVASRVFDREHRAVVVGRRKYAAMERRLGEHSYLLRRNIHMLEKGLVMRPRRPVFAVDYIAPTVRAYREMLDLSRTQPELVDARELQWATDVLTEYFAVAGSHPTIDKVRAWWQELSPPESEGPTLAPYRRDLTGDPPVSLPALTELARRRRSVRWFDQRPVPRETIDAALAVAIEAPSACNRQPFEFRIFDDPEMVQRVAGIPLGTRGYGHNIPVVAVIIGKMRAFFSERDRHLIYIDGSLAAMSFILALEAAGLSSCLINWPDVADEERRMAATLGLEPDERVVMLVAIGYPDPTGSVPSSGKKSLDAYRRYA
jgi:nitroreductase